MSEYRDGEVIPMTWEDPPTEWYVAGHVAFDVAIAEVQQHMDCYHLQRDKEDVRYALGECHYLWAEWVGVDEDEIGEGEDADDYGFYLERLRKKQTAVFQ